MVTWLLPRGNGDYCFIKRRLIRTCPGQEDEKKGRMSGITGGGSKIQTTSDQSDDY